VENRDEHNIPGLHTGAVDLFCDPPGADLLRAVLNETRANAAWRDRWETLITLFTHVQSCSSTAPIFVEILRSFSFFLIVSTVATILLPVVTLGASAGVGSGLYRRLLRRRGSPVPAAKGLKAMTARKILLIDDSETILQMEQMILAKEPYELLVARDGAEGLARALECNPDLILMDVVMPRMGGFEALRQLRGNQRTRTVPVVMVTTKAEAESIETGYASGCNDYIVKPIDSIELIAKVRDLLGD